MSRNCSASGISGDLDANELRREFIGEPDELTTARYFL